MKKVDYIVVGLGIAGISFCEELEHHQKSFVAFDSSKDASTKVAAGVINPVVLKRFTPVWNAKLHVSSSILFYKQLSKKIDSKLFQEISMFRIFKSIAEQNNWIVASDKKDLEEFLEPKIIPNNYAHINAPFGFGKVNSTGKIDTIALIEKYKKYLNIKITILKNLFSPNYKILLEEAPYHPQPLKFFFYSYLFNDSFNIIENFLRNHLRKITYSLELFCYKKHLCTKTNTISILHHNMKMFSKAGFID